MIIQRADAAAMNAWLTRVHYLHRPIIKSKLLAHGIYQDRALVGGLLWATPHFTKKAGLFGMPNTLDKWEVLMLARFYLVPDSGIVASAALSASIGRAGNSKSKRRRGWRLQHDWVAEHPPVNPDEPYIPRLLISWSDYALATVERCEVCGCRHDGQHVGTIYAASGWELWDVSASSGPHTGRSRRDIFKRAASGGNKRCWVLRLPMNTRAEINARQEQLFA